MTSSSGFSLPDLQKLLIGTTSNKLFIIKFGSPKCGPCNRIKEMAETTMEELAKRYEERVVCVNINIEEDLDLYGQLKRKRIVNGIPVILAYRGTDSQEPWFQPLDSVSGGDTDNIKAFFARCEQKLQ